MLFYNSPFLLDKSLSGEKNVFEAKKYIYYTKYTNILYAKPKLRNFSTDSAECACCTFLKSQSY